MATAKEKKIVEFYKKKFKETSNIQYMKAMEYWGRKFGIKVEFEEKRKKKEEGG